MSRYKAKESYIIDMRSGKHPPPGPHFTKH